MRFLGVTETCDLGALYLRLLDEGHEVRIAISYEQAHGTMAGMVSRLDDWRDGLGWVREAGDDGIILFESVSKGFGRLQDELRGEGHRVIGGSEYGDRLENDRGFAQALLADLGFPSGHVWTFDRAAAAIDHIARRPARYVLKFSGPDFSSGDNYLGQLADGADVVALLRQRTLSTKGASHFILMDFIEGIEIGVGAYFDGTRFLTPACLDWEHKRFFAGDMGELTGEMGTVATFDGTAPFFERTLRLLEPHLAGRGHIGYVNLNTIVNEQGIWPLEFTCRFGYPGFAILDPLQETPWGELFAIMLGQRNGSFIARPGFSTGVVVTTPPFPYSRKEVDEAVGLPILFREPLTDEDRRHVHLGEVGIADGQLVTSGLYGWTMVVTGTGATVAESRHEAYRLLRNIVVPRGRYRLDIGSRTSSEIGELRRMGLIGPISIPGR
ncbi:MAG: phosphoribosylamine--glycine ligase [Sphingomonadaceae bacterium]|nr:phosphoribosylamine--glycine ligase [Sphingomonadaceae bacterium]